MTNAIDVLCVGGPQHGRMWCKPAMSVAIIAEANFTPAWNLRT